MPNGRKPVIAACGIGVGVHFQSKCLNGATRVVSRFERSPVSGGERDLAGGMPQICFITTCHLHRRIVSPTSPGPSNDGLRWQSVCAIFARFTAIV